MEIKNSLFIVQRFNRGAGWMNKRKSEILFRMGRKRILIGLSFLLIFSSSFGSTIPKETVESLSNIDRVLSTSIELHITSEDAPFINASVSLNNEDAWVFFDNIKPSVLKANYASEILINGVALSGSNGRVAIYGNGSVVMPFPNTFEPLTVYTGENFSGETTQYSIHQYHDDLGDFDNAIQSFKLKRGYMATFANESDGSGYSRVFIANNEDLNFSEMPVELSSSVSFIRVFKYEWVSKKGKAGWDPHFLEGTCYYDWNIGGNSSSDVEYAAIRQNGGWPSWDAINSKQNISHLLGFNEPDRPDQSNISMQDMLNQWPNFMHSGLRIGSPAWSSEWNSAPGGGNLFDFMEKCNELNYRVDFVALHCYWVKSPQQWYNDLKYIHERTGRPLWITEWNNGANWTTESWPAGNREYNDANANKQLNDLKGILEVMDTSSFIERYFIYEWVEDCRRMELNGELTKAGQYYAQNLSEIAYNEKNDVKPHWNYSNPTLSYKYLTLQSTNRLEWDDPNGEVSMGYILEKKSGTGEYEPIFEVSADEVGSVNFYLDPLDNEITGTISYRLKLKTNEDAFLESNEVSYYQTGGVDGFQAGNLDIMDTEWQSALFSERLGSVPLVLLGSPTFYNSVQFTQRVNSISSSSFKLRFEPWVYLNNPTLTKADRISVLAMPEGEHNFGGLKGESRKIANVSSDWQTVTFNQTFTAAPVVFGTVASVRGIYPVTVAIQNITETGFEISLKTEEANAEDVAPEDVNILVIEPGIGAISDKRIVVQKSDEGKGISSVPYSVERDTSFKEPAVFGSLNSSLDNFASTVRHYLSGKDKVVFLKHREVSGGASPMQKDQFGWMIMDLSAGQSVPNNLKDNNLESISFYPNPTTKILNFNFNKETFVEVYDLVGVKRVSAYVSHSLDVGNLPSGIYVLKAQGFLPVSFLKSKRK